MLKPTLKPPTEGYWQPVCTVCNDTGWMEARGTSQVRVERCKGEAGVSCPYTESQRGLAPGVPVEESKATLDNYTRTSENGEAIKHAEYFLDGTHRGLYIFGGVGTGKTRLACSILNTLWQRNHGVRFKRCPELLIQLQPGHVDTDQVWQRMVDVPVLVLDDVGANQGTDFARRQLQALFDARLDRGQRTIWTSNLDLDELANFMADDRLPSRIMGHCRVVELQGKDWRVTRRKAK